jgi:hypothetical protein
MDLAVYTVQGFLVLAHAAPQQAKQGEDCPRVFLAGWCAQSCVCACVCVSLTCPHAMGWCERYPLGALLPSPC